MRIIRTSTRRVPQVILSCVLLCIINACETEPTLPPESPRTVLIYMVAQNNLSNNAVKDLNEIKTAVIAGDLGVYLYILIEIHTIHNLLNMITVVTPRS